MRRLIIVGSSGHGRVLLEAARASGRFLPVGFVDPFVSVGTVVMGVPVLGNERDLAELQRAHDIDAVLVGVGDNAVRAAVVEKVLAAWPAAPFASLVHPTAYVAADVVLGVGTVVLAGAFVGTGSRVGSHCIVNTHASADHDSVLGDFSSLAPGVILGGTVSVGEFSAVSLGARIIHRVSIGADTVVGAGATVVRDLPAEVVAYGSPCTVVRTRRRGERYL